MKGSPRRKGAERAVFLLIIPLFDKEEEATCMEESTYLSSLFFRIPFRRLLPLFVDLAPRSPSRAKKLAATNSG